MSAGTNETLFLHNITADCNFHTRHVKTATQIIQKQLQGIAVVIMTNLLLRVNILVSSCVDRINNLSKTSQKPNTTTR